MSACLKTRCADAARALVLLGLPTAQYLGFMERDQIITRYEVTRGALADEALALWRQGAGQALLDSMSAQALLDSWIERDRKKHFPAFARESDCIGGGSKRSRVLEQIAQGPFQGLVEGSARLVGVEVNEARLVDYLGSCCEAQTKERAKLVENGPINKYEPGRRLPIAYGASPSLHNQVISRPLRGLLQRAYRLGFSSGRSHPNLSMADSGDISELLLQEMDEALNDLPGYSL